MSINKEDLMLVNQSGVDYKTTAADLKAYLTTPPPMPWEEGDHCIFHIKNATQGCGLEWTVTCWDIDGTNERQIKGVPPGEEVVFVTSTEPIRLFDGNMRGNWEFGELTDVSKGTNFEMMFHDCRGFNSDIGDWDTHNAKNMRNMFDSCYEFNQNLSQWCVSNVEDYEDFDLSSFVWEEKNKPVWGTCPRGEDQ